MGIYVGYLYIFWIFIYIPGYGDTGESSSLLVALTAAAAAAKPLSRVWLCATPWAAAQQAPPSLGFSRQEDWSGAPSPSPMGCSPAGSPVPGVLQAGGLEWGAIAFSLWCYQWLHPSLLFLSPSPCTAVAYHFRQRRWWLREK